MSVTFVQIFSSLAFYRVKEPFTWYTSQKCHVEPELPTLVAHDINLRQAPRTLEPSNNLAPKDVDTWMTRTPPII